MTTATQARTWCPLCNEEDKRVVTGAEMDTIARETDPAWGKNFEGAPFQNICTICWMNFLTASRKLQTVEQLRHFVGLMRERIRVNQAARSAR